MTVTATPYGQDTSCTDRLRPGRIVSGATLLGEAAYRRLTTRRGTLLDDPTYGLPLLDLLSADVDPELAATYPGQVRAELLKDPRLEAVTVDIVETVTGPARAWTVTISGVGSDGDAFELVVGVSDVTVELLGLEAT